MRIMITEKYMLAYHLLMNLAGMQSSGVSRWSEKKGIYTAV
jgi:hypothetical protein